MNDTVLGKISSIVLGIRDSRFGLFITLSGSYGVQTRYDCWDPIDIIPDKNHKWTENDRDKELVTICHKISKLLHDAKVDSIDKLLNKPVEFKFENGLLVSWRILTEVL